MNRADRAKLLAESLTEANRKAKEERDFNNQVARVTADVKSRLAAQAKHQAESGREITCPHCNEKFTVSWRTDDVTSETANDDDQNEQDNGTEVNDYDNRKLTPLQRALKSKAINPFAED